MYGGVAAAARHVARKRLGILAQRRQPLAQRAQRGRAEARPHAARIAQLAALAQAHQQGAQVAARAGRFGIAADDEFLARAALQLQPALRAAGPVRRVQALADQAFQAQPAGFVPGRLAFGVVGHRQALREHQRRVLGHLPQQVLEPLLPGLQGQGAQVLAIPEGKVERDEHQPFGLAVQRILQQLEIGHAAFVEHDDLAVEPAAPQLQRAQRARQRRHASLPILVAAADQAHAAGRAGRQDAVAVVLDLVRPARPMRRAVHQRGQLGRQRARHRGAAPARRGRRGVAPGRAAGWPARVRRHRPAPPPRRLPCAAAIGPARRSCAPGPSRRQDAGRATRNAACRAASPGADRRAGSRRRCPRCRHVRRRTGPWECRRRIRHTRADGLPHARPGA
ncbi:hypothetical protein KM22_02777 [Bordetella bronchiseptica KM22]|nr:hypothetical protein KM22_02777 [Bordetella bronchiseptica KM22]